jgi:hypothetical protein
LLLLCLDDTVQKDDTKDEGKEEEDPVFSLEMEDDVIPAGVKIFKYKQSSLISSTDTPGLTNGSTNCQQSGPYDVASNIVGDHGNGGSGDIQRNGPTGGVAYGI